MYPRPGISVLFESMAAEVRRRGNCIKLGAPVVRLERDGDRIARVVYHENGQEQALRLRHRAVDAAAAGAGVDDEPGAAGGDRRRTAARLRYRSLKLIYIVLKRHQMTDYHWVYLLDEQFRVNRVSEQKNVSPHMVPQDKTVLCIELSLWRDEPLWQASDEEIYRLALRDLMKMGYGVTEGEVDSYHVTDIPTAYPVYELNFEDHLIPVLDGVHEVPNLLTLGRHGLFLNNSMDDNVLLGMKVAEHIERSTVRTIRRGRPTCSPS